MKTSTVILMALVLALPDVSLAENNEAANPVHKYWTCAISSYHSLVDGKYQEAQCRSSTEYSEPPCRGFVVEYEGANGVRPNVPYAQKISSRPSDKSTQGQQTKTINIDISKAEEKFIYTHTVAQTGANANNKWIYNGLCNYNEAPTSEKIYMDYGLKTTR
jgi:hypothetical protein